MDKNKTRVFRDTSGRRVWVSRNAVFAVSEDITFTEGTDPI